MISNRLPPFDFGLGETAEALREQVRRFTADEIAPRAADIDRSNDFPADLWRKMGSLGVLGITADEAYGGAGLGYLEHMRGDGGDLPRLCLGGLSYGAHSNLCVNQIKPQRQCRAEGQIPAEADQRRASWVRWR
jgi:isovaleryl-CoA dehydrogenase